MKRGALVNLLIGITIALLPLYNRIAAYDFNRTSKDNLLVILLGSFCFLLPSKVRSLSFSMWSVLIYGLSFLVINQWNVLSINVMFQVFYIASAILFFAHFYEKHDRPSSHYILNGMVVGALIQSTLTISGFLGHELYPSFVAIFSSFDEAVSSGNGVNNAIGSLGNKNILASYLAMTTLAFFSTKKKWLIIFPLIAIALTASVMGILSLLAGGMYYLNLKHKLLEKWQIYLSTIVAMIALPFLGLGLDSGRFGIWKDIFSRVDLKHFLIGRGPGWFPDQKMMIIDGYVVQEHNSFISTFNLFGIIGLLLILPIFIKFLQSEDKSKIFSSILFVAFCNSYGQYTLHQSITVLIIIVTACICLAEGKNNGIYLER